MEFRAISDNKRDFLPLLLLGDEQEDMISRYLDRGTLWTLYDSGLRAVCVVTEEDDGDLEIKNLAVAPESQRRGYGRAMVEHAAHGRTCGPAVPGAGKAASGGHRGQSVDSALL